MARVDLPESSVKARRRRRRTLLLWGSVALLVVVCGGVLWLANAEFLRIKTIETTGAKTVAAEALQADVKKYIVGEYLNLFPKNNIFLYPKEEITEGLITAHPTLKSVVVKAENFSTISVTALDREPRALWCGVQATSSEPCLLLDEDGVAYAVAPEFSDNPYKKYFGALSGEYVPQQFLKPDSFHSLSALVDAIAQSRPEDAVRSVFVDERNDVHIVFANGFALLLALQDEGGEVFERFTLALTAEPFKSHTLPEFEYLDLRFGDKLYYKLK